MHYRMIPPLLFIATSALAAAPVVDVVTLAGKKHSGTLKQLTAERIAIAAADATVEFPLRDLLEVRFPSNEPAADKTATLSAAFVDGTRLDCKQIVSGARDATVSPAALKQFSVPLGMLASVRFAKPDKTVDAAWDRLCSRELRSDILVIRKHDALDHLDGVVGRIDEKHVRFILDGNEVPVDRTKVFGVVYARRPFSGSKPVAIASLTDGGSLSIKSLTLSGESLTAELTVGGKTQIPLSAVQSLDFSLGKIRYLSAMEPREYEYTPVFDEKWDYLKDRNQDGGPIRIGSTTFQRGLWMHSRTRLVYRLGGDYRRFKAVMGIEHTVAQDGLGSVRVVITADGRKLVDELVTAESKPKPLNLDVQNVRDLQVLVDFADAKDLGIGDHLALGDARIVK